MLSAYGKRATVFGALGLLAWFLPGAAAAQSLPPRPYAIKADFQPLWTTEAKPIDIPVGDVPMSVRFDLSSVPVQAGRVRCLRFSVRLQTDLPAGWNNYLAVRVNGVPVGSMRPDRRARILNHGPFFVAGPPHNSRTSYVLPRAGMPNFNVFFMPDTFTLEESLLTDREEESWYLVDVDDLLGTGPVTLEFINTAIKAYFDGQVPPRMRMVIEGLELGSVPSEQVEALRSLRRAQRKTVPGTSVGVGESVATVTPAGGFYVQFGGATFFVDTSLRINGKNRELPCSEETVSGAERAVVTRQNETTVETIVTTDAWRLTRTLAFKENRIDVRDVFLNRTEAPLGISLRHAIVTPDDPSAFRLGGLAEDFRRAASIPENPTVFVAQGVQGLGAVAQDNALRLQMDAELTGNRASFGTDHLGIAPGVSYAVRWSLYPGTGEYFDFINRVRHDWGVNFTVPGPFEFVDARQMTDEAAAVEALRLILAKKDVQVFAIMPWFEYHSAANLERDEYRTLLRRAMQAIKAAKPGAICLAMVETNLTPAPMEFFSDGLPKHMPYGRLDSKSEFGLAPGVYGYSAPDKAAATIDASPWRDSVMRGLDNKPLLDTWYVQYYEGKALNLMVYPRPGNYWHAQMMEKLRFLVEDVGVDGVYIDQFSLAYGEIDHYSYDYWDGHTVDIDPVTGAVTRQYADLAWVSAPARLEWVQYLLQRGKMVVANSMPAVEELQNVPIVRFMETAGYDPMAPGIPEARNCASGLLGSPVGLGYPWDSSPNDVPWAGKPKGGDFLTRTVAAHLRYGLLYYYYGANIPEGLGGYGAVNHMFPFTPVELHQGWVRGKERIITCVSGNFNWESEGGRPRVFVFDRNGLEKKGTFTI
ncbi:MAG: hypothetical protein RBU21_17330, partial [FCB group bacterium]|nr:hypothetical protein [FCB group bacterium]